MHDVRYNGRPAGFLGKDASDHVRSPSELRPRNDLVVIEPPARRYRSCHRGNVFIPS